MYEDNIELEELQKLTQEMRVLELRAQFLENELRRFLLEELEGRTSEGGEYVDVLVNSKEDEYLLEWINLLFKKRNLLHQEELLRIKSVFCFLFSVLFFFH
jgi:hypothetical protein